MNINRSRARHVGPIMSVLYGATEQSWGRMARMGTLPVELAHKGRHVRDSHDERVVRELTAMMFAADSEQVA